MRASDAPLRTSTTDIVLDDVATMLRQVLGEYGLVGDADITMETTFHDDLELESIDLVDLAGLLQKRYGDRVNLAEFLAGLEVDQIINLSVGTLVNYVADHITPSTEL